MEVTKKRKHVLWERSHKLVLRIYRYTGEFPEIETVNLIRLVRSIGIKLCEEILRLPDYKDSNEFEELCKKTLGSIKKIRYYLFLAEELGYGKPNELMKELLVIEASIKAYKSRNRRNMKLKA
jgi:four helix bundle protein